MTRRPEDCHAGLRSEALREIAAAVATAYNTAQETARPDLGDNNWAIFSVGYARGHFAVRELANDGARTWLAIIDQSQRFIFAVNGICIRFFHGSVDDVPPHRRASSTVEAEHHQGLFGYAEGDEGFVFRLVIETYEGASPYRGYVQRVVLTRMMQKDGRTVDQWTLWDDESDGRAEQDTGDEQAPPQVRVDRGNEKTGTDDADAQ